MKTSFALAFVLTLGAAQSAMAQQQPHPPQPAPQPAPQPVSPSVSASSTTVQPSQAIIGSSVLRSSVVIPMTQIQNRLDMLFVSPPSSLGTPRAALQTTGISSGDPEAKWSLWLSGNRNDMKNTLSSTAYSGHANAVTIGGDYRINADWVAGVSISDDSTKLDTSFNQGHVNYDGQTFSAYVGGQINPWLRVSLAGGLADSTAKQSRIDPTLLTSITGNQDIDRSFVQVNAIASTWSDRWNFSAGLGYLYARDVSKDFTESNGVRQSGQTNNFGQVQLGAKAAYWFDGIMPYVEIAYLNDVQRQLPEVALGQPSPSSDRDSVRLGVGANIFGKDGWFGSLAANTEQLRSDTRNNSVMLNLGKRF